MRDIPLNISRIYLICEIVLPRYAQSKLYTRVFEELRIIYILSSVYSRTINAAVSLSGF